MQRHKMELRSRLGLDKIGRRVLRLLRDAEFPVSSIDQDIPVDISHDSQREVRSALLNAESRKAEALIEWQERRVIC